MLTDIEIAQQAQLKPIAEIAREIGVDQDSLEPYGKYKAKIEFSLDAQKRAQSNLILVTATPQ